MDEAVSGLEAARLVITFVIFTMVVVLAAPQLSLYAVLAISLALALFITFAPRFLDRRP